MTDFATELNAIIEKFGSNRETLEAMRGQLRRNLLQNAALHEAINRMADDIEQSENTTPSTR